MLQHATIPTVAEYAPGRYVATDADGIGIAIGTDPADVLAAAARYVDTDAGFVTRAYAGNGIRYRLTLRADLIHA